MKKLLFVAFLASSLSIFAQTEEGTWMIQGDTNLSIIGSASEAEYDGESLGVEVSQGTFEFNPAISLFVADNLAIGLGLELASTAIEIEIDGSKSETTSAAFALMPQATYFFGSSRTRPYLGVKLGLMSSVSDDGDNEVTQSGFGFGLNGGAAIFLSENVSLNLGLEFAGASLTDKDDDDLKTNSGGFGITVGFGIFL